MKQEFEALMAKEKVTPLEVSLFASKYAGGTDGAPLASELFDKLNKQA